VPGKPLVKAVDALCSMISPPVNSVQKGYASQKNPVCQLFAENKAEPVEPVAVHNTDSFGARLPLVPFDSLHANDLPDFPFFQRVVVAANVHQPLPIAPQVSDYLKLRVAYYCVPCVVQVASDNQLLVIIILQNIQQKPGAALWFFQMHVRHNQGMGFYHKNYLQAHSAPFKPKNQQPLTIILLSFAAFQL
jgi:hypothetical protein